jgi:hypothetical protein
VLKASWKSSSTRSSSATALPDAWHAYQTLEGRRLLGSAGCVPVASRCRTSSTDEAASMICPTSSLFYRFCGARATPFSEMLPHERSMPPDPVRRASRRFGLERRRRPRPEKTALANYTGVEMAGDRSLFALI